MSFHFESRPERTQHVPDRYLAIEAASKQSFYLNNPHRTFDAYQSINSIGDERVDFTALSPAEIDSVAAAKRYIAGGNMSPLGGYGPAELSPDDRPEDARNNMKAFFESLSVPETSVYLLNPDRDYSTPLSVVNVDEQTIAADAEWPLRLDTSGDFIYTRDPQKVLAVRPADCPVMIASADTPEGKIFMMVHYAWAGAASGYVEQTATAFNQLDIDRDSLEIYLTPGAQAENFPYTNYPQNPIEKYSPTDGLEELFVNITEKTNGSGSLVYDFQIDTPRFVYDQVIKHLGVKPEQVFCDTSDTGSLASGYSSHSRSMRLKSQGESNTRDIVAAVFSHTV